jgi:hypothetical protein
VFAVVDVLRRTQQSEARMFAMTARWKNLALYASYLVLLSVLAIV